jgi:DUF1365 family protein
VIPGPPAVCEGTVFHRRVDPTEHEFTYPVSYVWLDPDAPDELCRHHPLWSASHPAPARFRGSDYGDGSNRSLATQVREDVAGALGRRVAGPVRMLTQVRRWGWLFNPITLFLVWDTDAEAPAACVLEVTNTPWKERHRYVVALRPIAGTANAAFTGRVAKTLHVSPFLNETFDYAVRVSSMDGATERLNLAIDVLRPGTDQAVLKTAVHLARRPASRAALTRSLATRVAPTQRVSFGIHAQAARLWAKRVPIVTHPRKRKAHS